MAQIKIELNLDSTNAKDSKLFRALLNAFDDHDNEIIVEEKKTSQKSKNDAPETKSKPQQDPVLRKSANQMTKEAEEAALAEKREYEAKMLKSKKAAKTEEAEANVTIDEIRSLVSKLVESHRAEIKAKLTEFGAKSVTTLDPTQYTDFYKFLTSL